MKKLFMCFVAVMILIPFVALAEMPTTVYQFGTAGTDIVNKVVATSGDDILLAGVTGGALDGRPNAGLSDGFVRKMTTTGAVLWTTLIGSAGEDSISGMAVAADGNIFVVGTTTGSLQGVSGGLKDVFIAKLNADGVVLWLDQLGTAADDESGALAIDKDGNIWITGTAGQGLDGVTNMFGYRYGLLAKYSPEGNLLVLRQFNTAPRPLGTMVYGVVAYENSVYVTGLTRGSELGNLFLFKYDLDGYLIWGESIGDESTTGLALTLDATGIYVAGATIHPFDGHANVETDAIVIKYNHEGVKQWTKLYGTPGHDYAFDIRSDGTNVYALLASGQTDVAMGDRRYGANDVVLIRMDQDGNTIYTKQFGTGDQDVAYSMTLLSDGRIVIGGYTQNAFPGQHNSGGQDGFVAMYATDKIPVIPDVPVVPAVVPVVPVPVVVPVVPVTPVVPVVVPVPVIVPVVPVIPVVPVVPVVPPVVKPPVTPPAQMICKNFTKGWNTVTATKSAYITNHFGHDLKHVQIVRCTVGKKNFQWTNSNGRNDFNEMTSGMLYQVHTSKAFTSCYMK